MRNADRAPVSVVIPCYRCQGTLGRALASVAAQTWPPAEVIVVDDGSPEEDAAEISRLVDAYRALPVRYVRLDRNRGPGAARNAGWEAATQELVAFLDADDSWHPRKLEIQARSMVNRPELALSGHRWRVVEGDAERHVPVPEPVQVRPIGFQRLLLANVLATPTVMVRRQVPLRFEEGKRFSEDYLLWLRILARGHRAALLEAELAYLHKPPYGSAGLSGDLWRMELGELDTYRQLHREGCISGGQLLLLWAWSALKCARRAATVALRSRRGRRAVVRGR